MMLCRRQLCLACWFSCRLWRRDRLCFQLDLLARALGRLLYRHPCHCASLLLMVLALVVAVQVALPCACLAFLAFLAVLACDW